MKNNLPPFLKWTNDDNFLIFRLTEDIYIPYELPNGKLIYDECKSKKLLKYSYEYLTMICNCEFYEK